MSVPINTAIEVVAGTAVLESQVRSCGHCGRAFTPNPKHASNPNSTGRYCSRSCSATARQAKLRLARSGSPGGRKVHTVVCDVCGTTYQAVHLGRGRGRACSKSCASKLGSKRSLLDGCARRVGQWSIHEDGTATLPVGNGLHVVIDEADLPLVQSFPWWRKKNCNTHYARTVTVNDSGRRWVYFHHLIVGRPDIGLEVDHLDRNGLNNRRTNLRVVTASTNMQNSVHPRRTPGFRGVFRHGDRYHANLAKRLVGIFDEPELAAWAYDIAAVEQFGPDARCNFRGVVPPPDVAAAVAVERAYRASRPPGAKRLKPPCAIGAARNAVATLASGATFTVSDIVSVLSCSRSNVGVAIKALRAQGLVAIEKPGKRGPGGRGVSYVRCDSSAVTVPPSSPDPDVIDAEYVVVPPLSGETREGGQK